MTHAATSLVTKFRGWKFFHDLFAYGASEAGAKISRLLVVIVMARTLDAASIGLVATALAISEIIKSLTENGIGHRVISADPKNLSATCRQAHRLVWVWCIGLLALQLTIAALFISLGGGLIVAAMIALLGLEYLFMPGGLVSCALAMREGKLKSTAGIAAIQNVGSNFLMVALLLIWPDPVVVVAAKLATAPLWLIGMRRLRPFQPDRDVVAEPVAPFLKFGGAVLGVELLRAVRMQADKLVISALLGAEALGIYFFAVNAGLGIATSFATAFSTVLFPTLCASNDPARDLGRAILLALAVVTPIVALQVVAAPYYVSAVFGADWAPVAPLVSILCLAALPTVIWSAAGQWMRANGKAGTEFIASIGIAVALVAAVTLAAPYGLTAVAWAVLAAATTSQLIVSSRALRVAFGTFFRPSVPPRLAGA